MSDANTLASQDQLSALLQSRAIKPALIAGLVVYFLYLIVSLAPARYAAWAIHSAAPNVWLTSVRGTLWDGVAGGGQVDLGDTSISLGQVSWSLNPWTLLTLKPCIQFETESGAQLLSGNICQSPFGGTKIKDFSLDFPVSMLSSIVPVHGSGQFSVQIINADLRGKRVDALDARYSWQNASIYNGEIWWSLGAFGGQARESENGGITAQVMDISGPLGVDVLANFVIGSEVWTAEGTVKPGDGTPEQLVQALQVIGEETEPGTYKVMWP
ncbi:MAG: type II secretion system protein N [Agarilytica sp.]